MTAIVCMSCGSKIAATRKRCPKCRAHIVTVDPAVEAARSRRLAIGSAILVGTSLLTFGLLWITSDTGNPQTIHAAAGDPLASRRPPGETVQPNSPSLDLERQKAFMESRSLGALSYGSGDYAGALAQFEAAVAKNPQDAEALSNLGQVLVKLGRTEEAVPHLERACSLNPGRWAYRFNLARALALLGHWDASIESYRRAQQLFPRDYVTTFNLALTLHKMGDEAAAVEEYLKAIELNPDEPSFRMALGISYEALRKSQDAAAAYGEYLRLAPSAADAEAVRARIAQLTGQPAAATSTPAGL